MKRFVGALAVLLAACALVPAGSLAAGPAAATGGGRGTTDGVHAFSDFGFSVMRSSEGAVEGHFNCLMAGSSQFPGFTLMAVRGQVTHAAINGGTEALRQRTYILSKRCASNSTFSKELSGSR